MKTKPSKRKVRSVKAWGLLWMPSGEPLNAIEWKRVDAQELVDNSHNDCKVIRVTISWQEPVK